MKRLFCLLLILLGILMPVRLPADEVLFRQVHTLLGADEGRIPGAPANLRLEERVAARFRDSGFENGAINFSAPVFRPGHTELTVPDGRRFRVYTMHPTVFRPGNFKQKNFVAPLVYAGRGSYEDLEGLKGIDLNGALLLMDFDCGDTWMRLLRFGVCGFVFAGRAPYQTRDGLLKVFNTEVSVPRFFIDGVSGDALRTLVADTAAPFSVRVQAEPSRWENTDLRDLWVFIPGTDVELGQDVCVFTAPMDANGAVPELARGGRAGANLYALLQLLETFKAQPPARSILLAALNAHTQNFLGERMLAWHLLAPMEEVESVRNLLAARAREEQLYADTYRKIKLLPATLDADNDFLNELRTLVDQSTGRRIVVKEPLQSHAKRLTNQIKTEIMDVARAELTEAERKKRLENLNASKRIRIRVLAMLNKIDVGRSRIELKDLNEEETGILRGYLQDLVGKFQKSADLNSSQIKADTANGAVREVLGSRQVSFIVSLDMEWTSDMIGFAAGNRENRGDWFRGFGLNTVRLAAALDPEKSFAWSLADTMTGQGGLGEDYYFFTPALGIRYFHCAGSTPAFSLRNVHVDANPVFTPGDNLAYIGPERLAQGLSFVPALVQAIVNDADITLSENLKKTNSRAQAWAMLLMAYKSDEFSAKTVPQLPVPGTVLLVYPERHDWPGRGSLAGDIGARPIVGGDVINMYVSMTDARAAGMIYGFKEQASRNGLASAAFHYDADFTETDHALDMGRIQEIQLKSTIYKAPTKILPMFRCREFQIYERNDASLLGSHYIAVQHLWPYTGRDNSKPVKYSVTGVGTLSDARAGGRALRTIGPAAVYLERKSSTYKNDALKLLTDHKRTILNNTETVPEGEGFQSGAEIGPDFFATAAEEMGTLNRYRLKRMSGVINELVTDFLRQGDRSVEDIEAAREAHDHNNYLRSVYAAVGAQSKAYDQLASLMTDMLKAIVFYMALLLPFCFFLQKLIFRFVRIELQILSFFVLFVLTYVVFRMIHPAFRIARTPEAIFVAFVLGAIGAFVIIIMHKRFKGEMELIFRSYLGSSGEAAYGTVGQQALLVGINNMKRRRVRTTLTTATIILVTFTMLAFSSVSKKMSPTIILQSKDAVYTGVFFQWPGSNVMDEASAQVFSDMFSDRGTVIMRRWLTAKAGRQGVGTPLYLRADNGNEIQLHAVLGLAQKEDGFLAAMPVLEGGRFFSSDRAKEAIIPAGAAEALGITAADIGNIVLDLRGRRFSLVGIMDDDRFKYIKDLHGRAMLPLKPGVRQHAQQLSEARETTDDSGITYVDSNALLILPVETARDLGAGPVSVSVRLDDDAPLWGVMKDILLATRAKFYLGSRKGFAAGEEGMQMTEAGVYYVGSGYSTSIGGLARLLIPLLIAGTIIFNTMLGSVYERRNEIAVYNAIGLNPTHIAMFFLGEAFVYSILGSVGGYLIGQLTALGFQYAGLVSEVNVNFSSLIVAYVIAFTVFLVLVSTLYPAWVATRTAVPSGKRHWSMPDHDGQNMEVVFPFIYQPGRIKGVMAYLQEYFVRRSEESMGGDFISTTEGGGRDRDPEDRETYHLEYSVALMPHDLGVTQKVEFRAAHDELTHSNRIKMTITRISGQDTNWISTNKPFLERLRRYLLQWRNLDATRHAMYIKESEKMFATGRLAPEVILGEEEVEE